MQKISRDALHRAIDHFGLDGEMTETSLLPRGHIHDTFVSRWSVAGGERQYIHQRMNDEVFPNLDLLMRNIHAVTEHIIQKLGRSGADGFEPLQLIPTRDGHAFARTDSGSWRTFLYIENTESHDRCQSPDQAFEAARAFGWFQAQLADLPIDRLAETIPEFFSSPFRFRQFESALEHAESDRRQRALESIRFAADRRDVVDVIETMLVSGTMPRRVVHGDTKLNNILFDNETGKAKGIVDLDTCMAGYSLYDFGDLVRFTAAKSAEDETDMERVGTDLDLYKALKEGYLSTAGKFLSKPEIELMPFAARLVTFTIGLRFLADYLDGDRYFKTERDEQNLDRARTQFGMVAYMERHAEVM